MFSFSRFWYRSDSEVCFLFHYITNNHSCNHVIYQSINQSINQSIKIFTNNNHMDNSNQGNIFSDISGDTYRCCVRKPWIWSRGTFYPIQFHRKWNQRWWETCDQYYTTAWQKSGWNRRVFYFWRIPDPLDRHFVSEARIMWNNSDFCSCGNE